MVTGIWLLVTGSRYLLN